MNMPSTW